MSPIRYQQAARIRKSELLLSHSMLSVGQIAEQLGFSSPFHFSNAFKRVMGVSPTAFSRRMRSMRLQVERARALLREKRMPATETAHTLGFNTVEEFRRVFRHYNGVTPEEYAAGRPPVFSARPYGAPVERKEPRAATPVPARTGTS